VDARPADLVVTAGRVWSPRGTAPPGADAVAVRGGRITAVGQRDDRRELADGSTETLDVPGGTILPGFQDAHVHPPWSGLEMLQCHLHGVSGAEAYAPAIRAYAKTHPDEPWILGGGWTISDFPGGIPHRDALDAAVPDRPAFLYNRDGHGAWVNSRALGVAGITRDTPDPPDGRIERDPDGEPSGVLHEGATELVDRILPPTAPETHERATLLAQEHLHGLGITAWQDASVYDDTRGAYLALARRGALTARVVGALWWDRERGLEQVPDLVERRRDGVVGRFRGTSVKVMQDGIPENFTAAMLEPYLDRDGGSPDGRGLSFVEPALLREAVTALDREGFQVHVHAIGDRAVREALDAIEAARGANGPGDRRHHLAHLQVVQPTDVPRFARLEVVANCQPFWACLDDQMRDLCIPFLGPERSATQYPFRSLADAGARLAFGSDWSVTTADPWPQIQVAVTRVPVDHPEREPFLPGQALDLEDCLDAFTLGSAFVNRLDEETGTLEPGKLADLAVVDRDPFAAQPGALHEVRTALTMVGGAVVYERQA
jgi:predicted amidohydrolase YtcJ